MKGIGLAFISLAATSVVAAASSDYNVLQDIYASTNGATWLDPWNVSTAVPYCNWYGVTCNVDGDVTQLRLTSNGLSGSLPASIGALQKLEQLWLDHNPGLGGIFPDVLYNMTSLIVLTASNNGFTGSLPFQTGPLSANLFQIDLSSNGFSGSIPSTLAACTGPKYTFDILLCNSFFC